MNREVSFIIIDEDKAENTMISKYNLMVEPVEVSKIHLLARLKKPENSSP